jgi:signal transduction histidine kinase
MTGRSDSNSLWKKEYQTLFDRVPCYLTVIGKDFRIVQANDSFREKFGDTSNQHCYEIYKRRKTKCVNCPAVKTFRDGKVHRSHQQGIDLHRQKIYYVVTTSALIKGAKKIDYVIEISNDVTGMKKLEEKVIEAKRLGAVGQTVAGLAHSIKNILMGLEGGKYIVSLGLKKNDQNMINQGWEMLERNFDKTTSLVKDFLSFSKGRVPDLEIVNPEDLVREIVDLYRDVAAQSGIELKAEIVDNLKPVPLDKAGIHTCLTNLVSNALDACLMSDQKGTEVTIRLSEKRNKLIFEVQDNGSGIDYDIKKKIFTTFFTTKGGGGTGLGLLTTRKIVEEHGGKITVISQKGKGANFKMEFLHKKLMAIYKESKQAKIN